jgi:SPP1 family phage portal protein
MALIDIIKTEDVKEIKKLFARPSFSYEQDKAINEYKVEKHSVLDTSVRKNKVIQNGAGSNNTDGSEKTTETSVPVARIGLSYQKLIVKRRVGFMLTVPVAMDPIYNSESDREKELVKLVERIQNDNKIDYLNKEIARRLMSEMEVAEIWYLVESGFDKPKFTLKCDVWSKDLGDTLYPYFDAYGNMIAFAREYKLKEGDKDIEHFDIYLDAVEYKFVNRNSTWLLDDTLVTADGTKIPNPKVNEVGKIMIVYHSQQYPEWADQQTAIDRLETSYSNHADMNDYFGSPILSLIGELFGGGLVKADQGKIIQMEKDAKAGFLELNSKPESVKMEQENLHNAIMNLSQTPDISFTAMQGLGTIAQFTMKAYFMDAHMAVSEKEEIFGIGLQRRINIIKAAIGKVIDTSLSKEAETVQIKPVITPYLPQNDTEIIENLTLAKTGGIISTETAVEQSPLTTDAILEVERLKKEKQGEKAEID